MKISKLIFKRFIKILVLAAGISSLLVSCETTKIEEPKTETESASESETKTEESVFVKEEFIQNVKNLSLEGKFQEALNEYSKLPQKVQKKYSGDYEFEFLRASLLAITENYEESLELCNLLSQKHGTEELKKLSFSVNKEIFMNSLRNELKNGSEGALALYSTISPEIAEDFNINLIKASLEVDLQKYSEAEETCNFLEKINPNSTDVMEIRLMIAEKTGNSSKKNAELKKIIAKDPYNESANIELASSSAIKKNYKQAKSYYAKALAKNSKNEDALFGYGQMDYYLENDEKSKETFTKLIEINPQNAQAYSYLAKLAFADDEYKIAADNIEKAIAIDGENYGYFIDYGQYLRFLGHFDEAEKAWTRAIELDDSYFLGYAYRAGIYDEQDKLELALKDYEKVISLNPKYYFAYESIGIIALHEKKWEEAGKAFFECRKNNQENISYPIMVTYCYYMMGKDEEAKGNKVAAKQFYDRAKKYSNDILRKMGNVNSIEYKMLRVYHDEKGYQLLDQQIASLSNMNVRGKMYFYLAQFYDMFGDEENARKYYAKVLEMNSPMFFEYRLAEWKIKDNKPEEKF